MKTLIAPIAILLALTVTIRMTRAAPADDPNVKEGAIVSVDARKLVLLDAGGMKSNLNLADSVQVTINGKPSKLMDLKTGTQVRVRMNVEGDAVSIATIDSKIK
ncbi:MAG TPA: hypothetical protein VGY55_09770 [Pirellulales bacterium]|jgi:hypothetical protein|nr:hypothetical protein [Pirellulales bacterium]